MILIDTSVWVKALRRQPSPERIAVQALIDQDVAATTDLVIAEVLQGASSEEDFQKLAARMEGMHYFHATGEMWVKAATLSFQLKRRGLITPLADLVIATVARENELEVYATDDHFERVPGLGLYQPSGHEQEQA